MESKIVEREPVTTSPPAGEVERPASGFHTDQVLTISGGHFVHDTFSAFVAPLLPLLQDRLATNYTLTGGLAIFAQLPSLLNPFIGYLADKVSLRYFVILAPGVTATLMSSMGLTSNYITLALLLLAVGVSIAAFHAPAPAMIGRLAGRQVGKGMSIFMASGELGRTIGPVVAVAAVGWFGLEGIWRLAGVGWLVSGILYLRLRDVPASQRRASEVGLSAMWPKVRRIFPVIGWLLAARVFMMVTLTTFLPIFMSDVRASGLFLAAASLTILEGAGVVGALATGTLSDRLGRRRVLAFLLGLSPLLMLAFLYGPAWLVVPLLLALGLTAVSATPVILAVVQDQFTENRALANGIYLALSFSIRAMGIWVVGRLADGYGLPNAYLWSAIIALFAVPAVWFLPRESRETGVEVPGT